MGKHPVIGAYGEHKTIRAGRYKLDVPVVVSGDRGNQDFRDLWTCSVWGTDPDRHSARSRHFASNIQRSKEWDNKMARKTYRIELKVDFDDDARHEALLEVAKQYARDFLGSAMLLQDGRKPACVLATDDTFVGMEEIDILDASENLHEPATQP